VQALRRFVLRDERGQTFVLFAVLLPLILLLVGIAWDAGNWWIHRKHLQTQVDAAVLAAAPVFSNCFFDAPVANAGIAYDAIRYAGDNARAAAQTTTTVNQQVEEPNDVHVVLNSNVYWQRSDGTDPKKGTSADTGYGLDNSAGSPCETSTLEAKGTDDRVASFMPWAPLRGLGITPTPHRHARVEIKQVEEQTGMLPIAVPETDPAAVIAIFVDYAQGGTQTPIAYQQLVKASGYGGTGFPYAAWVTSAGQGAVCIQCDGTSAGTGVVILISKNASNPPMGGTLSQICGQAPNLIACYDGSGAGSGLSFIHSYGVSAGTQADPRLRDVNLTAVGCNSPSDLSAPYFTNDDDDCTAAVTAKVDFGVPGDPTRRPNQTPAGICATVNGLTWQSTSGTVSTWTGTIALPAADGHQTLNLGWTDKTSGSNCNSPQSGTFPNPAAVPYTADDASGPVDYLQLSATGPFGAQPTCPSGTSTADANSVEKGKWWCYGVAVGLDQPISLRPWDSSDILLRTASKKARATGDDQMSLNGALDCDHGDPLEVEFTNGCKTTYHLNYDKWGTPTCVSATAVCWKDITCELNKPGEYTGQLPPLSYVNDPAPICVAAKAGKVEALQHGLVDRFEDPCTPNHWPRTQAEADQFFKPVSQGGHDFSDDPRYVTLIITDQSAFSSPSMHEPVKIFAGFYVTGWDVTQGSGGNKPHGCYGFPQNPPGSKCGAPNNDPHPIFGCPGNSQYPGGQKFSTDNGDIWGHWVKQVVFSASGTASEDECALVGATSPATCIAVLTE
jgi:hypothetical protein